MKVLCVSLFVLLALCSQAQTNIRVMTYNIRNSRAADGVNNWDNRKQKLAALILSSDPDVLGAQEVRNDQRKDLLKLLKKYDVYGVGRDNGRHAGEHSAIFYKRDKYEFVAGGNFWLSEHPAKPGSKSWDAAITRICTWVKLRDKKSGASFYVFNAHLDHKGSEARLKSAELICYMIDSLSGDLPVILTGDFNFVPGSEPWNVIVNGEHKVPLYDSYPRGYYAYTNCGFQVANKNCSRIDYIFYSNHFLQNNYVVYTDNNGTFYPSDHLPVSADLDIR